MAELHDEASLRSRLGELIQTNTDVVSLRFGVREPLARLLFAAADGVLANSVSEPFGLVGLEAMTAGGVVYTGGTGEDYAVSGRNAVVLETLDPSEIADQSDKLASHPEQGVRLRRAARATAQTYTWDRIARILIAALQEQAIRQGILARALAQTQGQHYVSSIE
jgi:glycosyltransferase involved in cell wall biosynthesis